MEKLTIDVPAMYGDHHVIEVRRILLALPGVSDVYASSAFHVVEVTYDPAQVKADAIRAKLSEAGYTEELPAPVETGVAATQASGELFFRHSATYGQSRQAVSFAQRVTYSGRPLWYCPGMGMVENTDAGEKN